MKVRLESRLQWVGVLEGFIFPTGGKVTCQPSNELVRIPFVRDL